MSYPTSWSDTGTHRRPTKSTRRGKDVGYRRHRQVAAQPIGTLRAHPIMAANVVALRFLQVGTVVLCDFPFMEVNESKYRPGIVVSKTSHEVVVLPITSSPRATRFGDMSLIDLVAAGLEKESTVRLANRRRVDRNRIVEVLGHLGDVDMYRVFPAYEVA